MSWPKEKLGNVVEILDSMRKPVKSADRIEGPYPYYGANGQQGTINDFIFDEPLILVAEDGGHFFDRLRPIAYRIEGKTWVNNHAHVLRCNPDMDISYLCHQLARYNVQQYLTGSTRAKLTKGALEQISITKPPLEEQKRISSILDKAEEIRSLTDEVPTIREKLIRSIFSNMFGNQLVSQQPQNDFLQLSTILRKTTNLDPRTKPNMEFEMYSIPAFDTGSPQRLCGSEIGSSKKILIENDVIISRLIPHIRRVWIIPEGRTFTKLGSSEWIVFNSDRFDPVFLQCLLSSDEFHEYFMNTVAGVGGSLLRARPSVVMELYIMCPPLKLQNIFARNVEAINSMPEVNNLASLNVRSLSQEMLI